MAKQTKQIKQRQTTSARRLGRSQPPQRAARGGGAKKGLIMAVLPVVGGLVAKRMKGRRQATAVNIGETGAERSSTNL